MASAETTQADSFEIPDATMEKGVRIFNVLSSQDAVRIFLYAEQGIENSTHAIKDLGLTQKRYYSRLKGLIDVGLIEKVEGTYRYTALGKIVHKLGLYLIGVLKNIDRIELMNSISKAESLSSDERRKFEKMISEQTEVGVLFNSVLSEKARSKVKEIITYEELIEKLMERIDLAQKSVLLASRYIDTRAIDACLKANKRDVMLKVLVSKENISSNMNMLRLMLSPKLILAMLEFFGSSKEMGDLIREFDLSFSYCIMDDCHCFFEFPSLEGSKFSIAFYMDDEDTNRRFTELFYKQWEMAEVKKMPTFFEKLKKGKGQGS